MTDDLIAIFRQFVATRTESAFRRLYVAMTPRLYQFAYCRLAGDVARAQDATQETWCRVVASADRYGGRSSISTWILGIALNVCREIARDAGPISTQPETAADTYAPDSARNVDLARALGRLAEGYREVLLLHDLAGLNHEEISQLRGIDIGTSKSQLSRARSRLVDFLEGETVDARTIP